MTNPKQTLTKTEILNKLEALERENKVLRTIKEEYDKLKNKYDILVQARKEDEEKVKKAEETINEFSRKEQELYSYYQRQFAVMKKDLDSQNETIVTLFDLMDKQIKNSQYFYEAYKGVFISVQKKEE